MTALQDSEWLGPVQVSSYIDVPVNTLYRWRTTGYGPPAARVGKHLRYRKRDLDAWLERQFTAA